MPQSRGLLLVSVLVILGVVAVLFWNRADDGGPGTPDAGPTPPAAAAPAAMQTGGGESPERADVRSPAREAMAEPDLVPAPATEVERAALTGRLVHAGGAAAAGVEVLYTQTADQPLRDAATTSIDHKAKTDGDGRFALSVPMGRHGTLSLIGSGLVFAGQRERMPVLPLLGPRDLGDLTVAAGAVLAGVVRDVDGRPLPDVQVSAKARDGAGLPMLAFAPIGGSSWEAKTAADGGFRIEGLPAGEYRLATASARYLPKDQRIELRESEQRLDLVLQLEAGGTISGRVIDDLGRAVAGIKVGAYRNRDLGEGVQVKSLSRGESTVTDANGNFTLGGLAEASVQVRAWGEDYVAASRANVALDTHDVLLEVRRYGAIEGVLVDEQNQPIGGSRVSVRQREISGLADIDFAGGAGTETAADGTFRLERVRPGSVRLLAEGAGHVTASLDGVNVVPGETTGNLRLVGARGAVVVATVLDADGRPVAGAKVRVVAAEETLTMGGGMSFRRRVERSGNDEVVIDDGHGGALGEGTTDADGKVQIAGLPAGAVQVKSTHDKLAASTPARLTLPRSGSVETTLRLRRGGLAAITTFDADRRPLASVSFVVRGPLGGNAEPDEHAGTSGDDGRSQVGPLPTGAYEAFVRASPRPHNIGGAAMVMFAGSSDLTDTRVTFNVAENETTAVSLTQPPLCRFSGSVSDASGPVTQARVELVKAGEPGGLPGLGGAYTAESAADGTFAIDDVPPGDYTIRFGRRGALMPMEESLVLSGQREVVRPLVLIGGAIKVTVFSEHDGDFLSNAKVTLRRAGAGGDAPRRQRGMVMIAVSNDGGAETTEIRTGEQSVKTDDEGVALLEDVPPGRYTLEIDHPRHMKHKTDELVVTASTTTDAGQIKLDIGGAITGKLPGGQRALVELYEDGATEARETEPALGGSFRFTGLRPGRYRVRARALGPSAGEWGPFETVDVERGKSASVNLRLQ